MQIGIITIILQREKTKDCNPISVAHVYTCKYYLTFQYDITPFKFNIIKFNESAEEKLNPLNNT